MRSHREELVRTGFIAEDVDGSAPQRLSPPEEPTEAESLQVDEARIVVLDLERELRAVLGEVDVADAAREVPGPGKHHVARDGVPDCQRPGVTEGNEPAVWREADPRNTAKLAAAREGMDHV